MWPEELEKFSASALCPVSFTLDLHPRVLSSCLCPAHISNLLNRWLSSRGSRGIVCRGPLRREPTAAQDSAPPEPSQPSQLPPRLAELRAPSVENPPCCRVLSPSPFYLPPLFSPHNARHINAHHPFLLLLFITLCALSLPPPTLSPRW